MLQERKVLGKIIVAEYGIVPDYQFMVGLHLEFQLADGWCIGDGYKYTVNLSPHCEWNEEKRSYAIVNSVETVNSVLTNAKVNTVSELIGKPVEIEIANGVFKDFRILTEVL